MITAHPTTRTAAQKDQPTPKALCLACEGSGLIIEYRLTWKTPRPGLPPQKHSRRVDSEAEGIHGMHELFFQAAAQPGSVFEVDVESGAKACSCRAKQVQQDSAELDRKSLAAGDRG